MQGRAVSRSWSCLNTSLSDFTVLHRLHPILICSEVFFSLLLPLLRPWENAWWGLKNWGLKLPTSPSHIDCSGLSSQSDYPFIHPSILQSIQPFRQSPSAHCVRMRSGCQGHTHEWAVDPGIILDFYFPYLHILGFPGGQWLRIHLHCRRHWFKSWSRKIPHVEEQLSPCTTTTKSVSQNYWPHMLHLLKPMSRASASQQEKLLQWEACTLQPESSPAGCI